ncbi:MAG: hypothetical protein EYC68_06835 [Chloroflexota bacterium]|nr:MAG: hypothetical protein EYC68_06835 [Chloroflexota bacterium]
METTKRVALTREEIAEIVRGLDPIDWVQLRLIAQLPPEEQIMAGMRAAEFARAIVRGALMERFPNETRSQINMRVLRHFTTVRMESK